MKSANPLSDALHVMAHLVGHAAPRTSEQLASCLPTHPVVIRRLLAQLHKAGLVRSTRGHGGGSLLARDAAAITLHDIYLAVGAPPLVQVGARDSGGGCPIQQLVNSACSKRGCRRPRWTSSAPTSPAILPITVPWKVTMNPDVLIVGGSYAGIAAGLILARARRPVTVIDAGSPRNRFASHSHGVLGLDGISGAELLKTARQQLLDYPTVRWVHAEAVQATASAEGVEVRTADGQVLAARKLLLASGIADQLPALPGLAERWGSTVLHCPYCHGYEVGGGAIGLLGGHPMSASKAPLFADWGNVTFFSMGLDITDEERAAMQQRGVQIETSPVLGVQGDQPTWLEVELADGRRIAQRALFVPATQAMATPLVQQLGCTLVESPLGVLIEVDAMKHTSVPNVYAAGDATTVGNITLAMAEGVRAGIGVHHALVAEDSVPR